MMKLIYNSNTSNKLCLYHYAIIILCLLFTLSCSTNPEMIANQNKDIKDKKIKDAETVGDILELKSRAVSMPLLITAIENMKLKKEINKIEAINKSQQKFMAYYDKYRKYYKEFLKHIEVMISNKATEINNWLKTNSFSIELEPLQSDSFFIAGLFKKVFSWKMEGQKHIIKINKSNYASVIINSKCFEIYRLKNLKYPLVKIETKDGNLTLFISKFPEAFNDDFELFEKASSVIDDFNNNRVKKIKGVYDCINFPQINISLYPDVNWLAGLKLIFKDDEGSILQAKKQIKLKWDEKGGKVEAAFIAEGEEGGEDEGEIYEINDNFLGIITIKSNDLYLPLMSLWLTKEAFIKE